MWRSATRSARGRQRMMVSFVRRDAASGRASGPCASTRERPDRAQKGGWAATTVDQSSRPMWGQRLPGAGGIPPGLVRLRLGGGAPYFSRVPTAGGAAVVAVVWLDSIVQLEHEVRVAATLRKILPTTGKGEAARTPSVSSVDSVASVARVTATATPLPLGVHAAQAGPRCARRLPEPRILRW